jgi:hypothetical protein
MRECARRFEWGEGSTAFLVGPPGKSVFKNQGVLLTHHDHVVSRPIRDIRYGVGLSGVLQHCKRKNTALPRLSTSKSNYVVNERSNSDYWMSTKSCQRCQACCD